MATREPCELNCDCDLCRVEAECHRLREQVAADHDTILALARERDEARTLLRDYHEWAGHVVAFTGFGRVVERAIKRWKAEDADPCAAWDARHG